MSTTGLPFFSDCVSWPRDLLPELRYLVDEGVQIKRETFMRRVDTSQIPATWYPHARYYGYAYYTIFGEPVYWYVHSAIEFVFAEEATIRALRSRII